MARTPAHQHKLIIFFNLRNHQVAAYYLETFRPVAASAHVSGRDLAGGCCGAHTRSGSEGAHLQKEMFNETFCQLLSRKRCVRRLGQVQLAIDLGTTAVATAALHGHKHRRRSCALCVSPSLLCILTTLYGMKSPVKARQACVPMLSGGTAKVVRMIYMLRVAQYLCHHAVLRTRSGATGQSQEPIH